MKSLPEKDFWNNIKTRLSNYTEDPEDDWDDIAALISPSRYDSRKWIELTQDITSAALLILLLLFTINTTDTVPAKTEIVNRDTGIDYNGSTDQTIRKEESASIDKQKENQELHTNAAKQKRKTETPSDKNELLALNSQTDTNANTSSSNINKRNYSNNELYPQSNHPAGQVVHEHPANKIIEARETDDTNTSSTSSDATENSNRMNAADTRNDQRITLGNPKKITNEDSVKNIVKTDSIAHKEIEKTEEQPKKKRTKKFHPAIYFTVSPSLAYQKIVPVKNDAINITELKSNGIFSSNRLGLAIDGGFQIPVTKAIEVYAGLSYYQQNQTITYKYSAGTVEEIEGNQDDDYIIKPGIKQRDFPYAMRNAGISAGFFYRLKTDKLMHKIGAGLQYQKGFLRAGEGDTYTNRSSNYFNYQLLYRLELAVNPRTNFYIQPSFTHAIHASESLTEPFTLKPYRAAIGIGMIYRF